MSRPLRIQVPGITFHVVQRGNDRNKTFFVDDDYRSYLYRLTRMCNRYETSVHAYVLMTNHVHLLMTSQLPNGISLTMQQLSAGYTRRINSRDRRTGTLWEGRFKSSAIDSEFYCLACYRYIELNPVRAGIVAAPGDYRWSSYHENVGKRALSIITPHPCYEALGRSRQERETQYRSIVHEHIPDRAIADLRQGVSKGLPVGGEGFRKRIESATHDRPGARKLEALVGEPERT